jgi:glycosyl transferase family 87
LESESVESVDLFVTRLLKSPGVQIALFLTGAFLVGLALMSSLRDPMKSFGPVGLDLYPRWVGGLAVWRGESPYTQSVKVQSQELISGRPSRPDENAHGFYYPAYIAVIILPLLTLPVEVAGVVWSAFLWALLLTVAVWWSWRLVPRPVPWVWGLLLISVLFYRPAFLSVIAGQYGLVVLVCGILAWLFITRGWDVLAGIALAFASVKPSLSVIALLVLVFWSVRWRRWKIVSAFGITMIIFLGITLLRIGWWIPDFIRQAMEYSQDNRGVALVWSSEDILTFPGLIWLLSSFALTGFGLRQLWRDSQFPTISVMGTLCLNLLLVPHTLEYDLVVLLALFFWFGRVWHMTRLGLLVWLILIWVPWLSWEAVISAGASLRVWQIAIWQFYPTLMLWVTMLWLARNEIQDRLSGRRAINLHQ